MATPHNTANPGDIAETILLREIRSGEVHCRNLSGRLGSV